MSEIPHCVSCWRTKMPTLPSHWGLTLASVWRGKAWPKHKPCHLLCGRPLPPLNQLFSFLLLSVCQNETNVWGFFLLPAAKQPVGIQSAAKDCSIYPNSEFCRVRGFGMPSQVLFLLFFFERNPCKWCHLSQHIFQEVEAGGSDWTWMDLLMKGSSGPFKGEQQKAHEKFKDSATWLISSLNQSRWRLEKVSLLQPMWYLKLSSHEVQFVVPSTETTVTRTENFWLDLFSSCFGIDGLTLPRPSKVKFQSGPQCLL